MQWESEDLEKDQAKCIFLSIHNVFLGQMNGNVALPGLTK